MKQNCPECGKEFIRRIPQAHVLESILGRFSVQPFRCQLCTHRFVRVVRGSRKALDLVDNRQYQRFPTDVLATLIGVFPLLQPAVTELSMGGCTLHTKGVSLKAGSFAQMQVKTSRKEDAIRIETVMVRSARPQFIGVEFLEIREEERERLSRFIHVLHLAEVSALEANTKGT